MAGEDWHAASPPAAALAFADALATRPDTLGAAEWDALAGAFSAEEMAEVVAFCAWQFGGPRMLRSWRAEDYKRGERPELDTLPVRLAYADQRGAAPTWPAREY